MKIEILSAFIIAGGRVANVGDVIEFDEAYARQKIYLGFAKPVVDPPAPAPAHDPASPAAASPTGEAAGERADPEASAAEDAETDTESAGDEPAPETTGEEPSAALASSGKKRGVPKK